MQKEKKMKLLKPDYMNLIQLQIIIVFCDSLPQANKFLPELCISQTDVFYPENEMCSTVT